MDSERWEPWEQQIAGLFYIKIIGKDWWLKYATKITIWKITNADTLSLRNSWWLSFLRLSLNDCRIHLRRIYRLLIVLILLLLNKARVDRCANIHGCVLCAVILLELNFMRIIILLVKLSIFLWLHFFLKEKKNFFLIYIINYKKKFAKLNTKHSVFTWAIKFYYKVFKNWYILWYI